MPPELLGAMIFAIIMLIGVKLHQKMAYLKRNGKKTQAVIFKNSFKRSGNSGGLYYLVVRLTTEIKEWITQELDVGFLPAKPEGTKIGVIYDPDESSNVAINSSVQLEILPRLLIAIGAIGFILSALDYEEIIQLFSEK
ncbi:MAG: DUF3592 domain-containing protein [Cyclobacteriaceae bacterium]